MKRLKRLAEMEVALCEILGGQMVIVPFYKSKELPTEDKLREFLDIIEKMETKKVHRTNYCLCSTPNTLGYYSNHIFFFPREDNRTVDTFRLAAM